MADPPTSPPAVPADVNNQYAPGGVPTRQAFEDAVNRIYANRDEQGNVADYPNKAADLQIADAGMQTHGADYEKDRAAKPYGILPTVGRYVTGLATAMPTLFSKAINAGADLAEKYGISSPVQPVQIPADATPQMRASLEALNARRGRLPENWQERVNTATGIPNLPADAPVARQAGEAVAQLFSPQLLTSSARAIVNAPTLARSGLEAVRTIGGQMLNAGASYGGQEALGAAGEAVAGPEGRKAGETLGSLLGPAVVSAAARIPTFEQNRAIRTVQNANDVLPNAADIDRAAQRVGVDTRFGMVTGPRGQQIERDLRQHDPNVGEERARMATFADTLANRRETLPTPSGGPADPYIAAAESARRSGAPVTPAVQDLMQTNTSSQQPTIDIRPLIDRAQQIANAGGPRNQGYDADTRRSIVTRIARLTQDVAPQFLTNTGELNPTGKLGVPEDRFRQWMGKLGEATYDSKGNTMAGLSGTAHNELYGAGRDVRRNTLANEYGINPEAFDAVQGMSHREAAAADLRDFFGKNVTGRTAPGGAKLAEDLSNLARTDPGRLERLSGSSETGPTNIQSDLNALALVGRQSYPRNQPGGMTRSMYEGMGDVGREIGYPLIAENLLPRDSPTIARVAMATLGAAPAFIQRQRLGWLNSPETINALVSGSRVPYRPISPMEAQNAAQAAQGMSALLRLRRGQQQ